MMVLWPESGESQTVLSAWAVSHISSALNIQYAPVSYFGVVYPEPHQYLRPLAYILGDQN